MDGFIYQHGDISNPGVASYTVRFSVYFSDTSYDAISTTNITSVSSTGSVNVKWVYDVVRAALNRGNKTASSFSVSVDSYYGKINNITYIAQGY